MTDDIKGANESAEALGYYPGDQRLQLATAYVPPQVLREMFTLPEALRKGTLFPELYRPYPHHYDYVE
ncbi:spore coat protein CotB [Thermacetogenium phaeum DSM 12270]|jgi:hypothetical protein|uniref:Spore coat protein CotB n=1 Tax=Thermacetogenium phaeum (strain ATCC BAA-254 / DSM 26808 / PB) TaxID=1089553 RepID=K4LH36_THEPS|nr:spore coat associated protein CotJA [Thermacetogenium phaeum]AFV12286.1 spore coat protein CotB [Thermacetogenium phaeum DSM 12270]MDK2881525.1 hypothetical protein [Clostridia bacterium]